MYEPRAYDFVMVTRFEVERGNSCEIFAKWSANVKNEKFYLNLSKTLSQRRTLDKCVLILMDSIIAEFWRDIVYNFFSNSYVFVD